MSREPLIFPSYTDNEGHRRSASKDVLAALQKAVGADPLPDHAEGSVGSFLPEQPLRQTGLALQLYALRRRQDWGMGDFTSLGLTLEWGRGHGLDYIGMNPLHALSLAAPEAVSPYYPSSRLALHPLYIDCETLADDLGYSLHLSEADRQALQRIRRCERIDYEGLATIKMAALKQLYEAKAPASIPDQSEAIRAHALHEAYRELHHAPPPFAWDSEEASEFAERHEEIVGFHRFLQWAADRQLRAAAKRGGGRCELYLDLAVGAAPNGSEAWFDPQAYVQGVRLGAPPDIMAPGGQDWGLVPLHPKVIAEREGSPFARILDASAQYAGALRIDHALGLNRQYFIPEGFSSAEATYVRFPQNLLLRTIADSANKHRCVMIGEDLVTVPEGLTEALHRSQILSYEVTRWARDEEGSFLPGADYPELSLAAATTHDIAPLAGWLSGSDLQTRLEVGHLDRQHLERELEGRKEERAGLLRLWNLDPSSDHEASDVVIAAHRFLARSAAGIAMMAAEDLLLQEEMVNLPGTMDEHPNWRRRYGADFEDWREDEAVLARLRSGLR
jgi:4-alpha-glucanotransferase